ncbi:MAG: TonB-dependent receptor [Sphingobacteriales bacterium]|nr:MAG: TonB-dependent receptor [Sphingobacteriales bacterium]
MKFPYLLSIAIALLLSSVSVAQPLTIRGSILDTVNNFQLPYASVTLMHKSDSVLETFTRTAEDGSFILTPSAKGSYILTITYPSFVDYVDIVDVKSSDLVDLGQIPLLSRNNLLKEVVYTQQIAAIKVKGDTLEYVADSFKVRDNATVESLLKKLPGIQVDKNGKIIAQGQTVEKVLVDGEEFFSDDPAVVTKSLQANAVDKVQVFDKKSEQAEFTGIDDGEKTRTINLQLKEDKKKGYFGKLAAAGGTGDEQGYFENQAMFNAFKGKRKLSAFGIMSNTGKIGLGWEDRDKFGGSNNNATMTDEGYYMITSSSDDDGDFDSWSGKYDGQGLPRAWTGGAHYSNKWNEDQHHTGVNYRYGKQIIETTGNTLTEYNLPNNTKNFTEENRQLFKEGQRNKVDGMYEWKPDTTSSMKVIASASNTNSRNVSDYRSKTIDQNGNILNTSDRTTTSDAIGQNISSSLDWRKKLKKKGRTVSINFTEKYRENESDGYLDAINKFNDATTSIIDQHKENDSRSLSLSSRVSYTEPLSKRTSIEANYSLKLDNSEARRLTTRKSGVSDAYDVTDSLLSSNYAFNVMTNAGGANFRYNHKNINFSVGGSVSHAGFDQKDLFADTSYKYDFVNFFPAANFTYKLSKQSKFNISYRGSTNQPTINQIQPLRDNTDPLNITIGNANLKQEFSHSFNGSFNDYKVLTGRWIWSNAGINFVNNDISRTQTIDSQGRKTNQFINVDGNYNSWGYFGYGFKLKKMVNMGFNVNYNLNHVNNFINGQKNISDNNSYTGGLDLGYDSEDEKFEISLNPSVTYNDNRSTVNTLTTSFWNTSIDFSTSYELPLKFEIGTDFSWNVRQQTSVFDQNNNVFIWNGYVSKKFLKNDQLELRASVSDILNQNIGFNRYAQNNYIYQDNFNRIRRYVLIGLTWNFTKSALGAPQGGNTITVQ